MLLRFNEGAIVRLKLVGFQEPFSVEGRVVVVTSDEVVIAPQVKIISDGSSIPFQTIDDGFSTRRELSSKLSFSILLC